MGLPFLFTPIGKPKWLSRDRARAQRSTHFQNFQPKRILAPRHVPHAQHPADPPFLTARTPLSAPDIASYTGASLIGKKTQEGT